MQINHCPKTKFRENMNDWHSIRFLLIGAVAAMVVASGASLFIQNSYAFGDRHGNDQQDCKSIQGKGPMTGREDMGGSNTRTDRGLPDLGWMARYRANNIDGGNDGNGGHSVNDGSDGHARSADDGTNGRAGTARTICVIVDPEIEIPSNVPLSYVMSRPNWDNAIINPLAHLNER
ncbi:MAG TPA: hypothetical protein VH500_09915 [Nitrososphaeraceae archaeon]|jgi:hypothetical protein